MRRDDERESFGSKPYMPRKLTSGGAWQGNLRQVLSDVTHFLGRDELPSRSFRSMGGLATVTLGAAYSLHLEPIAAKVRALFEGLERDLSVYRTDSFVSLLAEKAGVAPIPVSDDASRVLSLSQQFGELCDGAMDVTVAPLVKLWGFGRISERRNLPPDEAIQERLALVNHRRMILENGTAFLPNRGMAVDVGGIAKGYAVDRAFDLCREAGIKDFLVDLSGNLRFSGCPQRGEQWEIGVRDPFDRSSLLGRITLPSGFAVATSGCYERFIEVVGQRYSHVLDPRTGYPVTGTAGVTVLARDATTADGLSTALLVVGLKGCSELLQKAPEANVLIVPDKYPVQIWLTRGLAEAFVPEPRLANAVRVLTPTPP
jgi:thiamine biosynthesis lipoprotein